MSAIHADYITLLHLICQNNQNDRHVFINQLESMFSGRQTVTQVVFQNLIKAIGAIYESYFPQDTEPSADSGPDFRDLCRVRTVTQQYFMQIPAKPG